MYITYIRQCCAHCILQYSSNYTECANEDMKYAEPAEEVEDIYDQLAQEKCIEIPRQFLK